MCWDRLSTKARGRRFFSCELSSCRTAHRNFRNVQRVMEKHPDADLYIHLGDGEREFEDVQNLYPDRRYLWVAGNCDFGSETKNSDLVKLSGKNVLITHGHTYYVKHSLSELKTAARVCPGQRSHCTGTPMWPYRIRRRSLYHEPPQPFDSPAGRTYLRDSGYYQPRDYDQHRGGMTMEEMPVLHTKWCGKHGFIWMRSPLPTIISNRGILPTAPLSSPTGKPPGKGARAKAGQKRLSGKRCIFRCFFIL